MVWSAPARNPIVPCPVASTKSGPENGLLVHFYIKSMNRRYFISLFSTLKGMMIKVQIDIFFCPNDRFLFGILEFLIGARETF